MRAIDKPAPPQLRNPSLSEYMRALGNAVGRFCSFCEKALTYRLWMFHKERGLLTTGAQLTSDDWASLLLICGDCAACVERFDSSVRRLWPDTPDALQVPFIYSRVDGVAVTAFDPDGRVISRTTTSAILVRISTDVPLELQAAAHATYSLFRLNGRFFNESLQSPAYELPYEEYVHPTDVRPDQRWDVHARAVEAGQALARGIPTIGYSQAYTRNLLAMIELAVQGFGFVSTWISTIQATLNEIDATLLPALIALTTSPPPPHVPVDRKRSFWAVERGMEEAKDVVSLKRARLDEELAKLIATKT